MPSTVSSDWDVYVDDGNVVVELRENLELDKQTGEEINSAFFDAVQREDVQSALLLLRTSDPLSSGVFEEMQRGAEEAARNGVDSWAVVVESKVKGMAVESQIDGLETEVFEDERDARQFLE